MKRLFLLCAVLMTAFLGANAQKDDAQSLSGEEYLKGLKGVYVELFSQETCLNPKFDALWKSEALKYVDISKVDSVLEAIQGVCQGMRIGADAIAHFKQQDGMQFCCAFQQGVSRFVVKGHKISGYNANNKLVFAHKYHFLEMDANGNYIFESTDNNQDEFRYFWFMPDSPKSTYHIEFRYGNDKAQLSQMMEGKYAFWMAAGVRKGHEDEWRKGISLFVEERLKGE